MKKLLLIAVATLVVGAVTASAAVITATETLDTPQAYRVVGDWTPVTTDQVAPVAATDIDLNWSSSFSGTMVIINGVNTYVLAVDAIHNVGGPAQTATAALGLMNVDKAAGAVTWTVDHLSYNGDNYILSGTINPVGKYNFVLDANCDVPEPASFALIAGLGLIGFAGFRRMRA